MSKSLNTSARGGRASTPRKGSPRRVSTVLRQKTHSMEGDGLITGFYGFLSKRDTKELKGCQDVFVPDTIVYTNNFPRGWYYTDKSREVMQRPGVDLDSSKVYEYFKQPASKNVGIVASYMSVKEENDETTTHVEFFNERTLKEFVERKKKDQGILQKFIVPKGGTRNTVIQAVWSPRVLCVWRRQNRLSLTNGPQAEKDPYPMCVTYDGPSHFSEESTCASNTSEEIKLICSQIVKHFYHTMEHKFLTRMVLYFKVDEFEKPWLMWCGSLRVADRSSVDTVSLNFAPRNDNALVDARREEWESNVVLAMDERYVELANDKLFERQYYGSTKEQEKREREAERRREESGGEEDPAAPGAAEKSKREVLKETYWQHKREHGHHGGRSPPGSARATGHGASMGLYGSAAGGGTTRSTLLGNLSNSSAMNSPNSTARGGGAAAVGDDDLMNGTTRSLGGGGTSQQQQQHQDDTWHRNPQIHDAYIELCAARDKVLSHLDDIFYEAYGHFLKYKPGNFPFFVEKSVARTLGNDALAEAMLAGGITKAAPSSVDAEAAEEDDDLCFEIPALHRNGPVSKVGDSVKNWVLNHYDKLIVDLKDEAASIMPTSGAAASRRQKKEEEEQQQQQQRKEQQQGQEQQASIRKVEDEGPAAAAPAAVQEQPAAPVRHVEEVAAPAAAEEEAKVSAAEPAAREDTPDRTGTSHADDPPTNDASGDKSQGYNDDFENEEEL